MVNDSKKRLIIVLGMHRSGTSAITRGLKALGVELGDNLMPAVPGNNEKGFWEDLDIYTLNVEILAYLGFDWDSAVIPTMDVLLCDELLPFRERAIDLLREKIMDKPVYGIKDPRFSTLLPFWKKVFDILELQVSYVVAIRNPMCIASSLAKRDRIKSEKSYYLWMQHITICMLGTEGCSVVLIDYDLLMEQPDVQLSRLADMLELESSSTNAAEIDEYINSYLDPGLRHTNFSLKDLQKDAAAPTKAISAYKLLLRISRDELAADSPAVSKMFSQMDRYLKDILPALEYIKVIEEDLLQLNELLTTQEQQIGHLNEIIIDCEAQIANLSDSVAVRDGRIAVLDATVVERDREISDAKELLVARDEQDDHYKKLLAERDVQIKELTSIVDSILHSRSWRITAPLRWPNLQLARLKRVAAQLKSGIKKNGGFIQVVRKAVVLFRLEGFSGLGRGVAFLRNRTTGGPESSPEFAKRNNYSNWISLYDEMDDDKRRNIHTRIEDFSVKPLISVVMPVYNPKLEWLRQAIKSVQEQLYPNWELCIADDLSSDPGVRKLLEKLAASDSRIKVVFREENGHISAASNTALELVVGDWVALLDHDDLLSEHALFWVVDAINNQPAARLLYSDEDKVDARGIRRMPYFKTDWNAHLFYSHNMICHLGVYSRELIERVGGFRLGMEGAQDYDLALRCIEHLDADQIHHIPRVLYHWRMHDESTAKSGSAKPYAMLAGERALNEHFVRTGVGAKVELAGTAYRAHYALPDKPPPVSIIIPTRNGLDLLRKCISSIFEKTTYPDYEVIVVDNGSDDPDVISYFDSLSSNSRFRVIRDDRPFNYSALNNSAVDQAGGDMICLLNNDIEVISPGWLSEMVSHALCTDVGAVGARLWYPDNTLQHGGVVLGIGGVAGHSHKYFYSGSDGYFSRMSLISEFSAVTAACLVIEKSIFKKVGGLNEKDLQIAFNDVDFCLRVRQAGYRNVWTPYAELYHYESVTRGHEDTPEKQNRFAMEVSYMKDEWGDLLETDPAYSPNLTLEFEDFSYAWPPRVESI